MRTSFRLPCQAELWGILPGPLLGPGRAPHLSKCHPTLPEGSLPVSDLETVQPQGLSSGWTFLPCGHKLGTSGEGRTQERAASAPSL